MKILSHTLINKVQLAGLQQLVKKQQSEIAGASKFVKEIEQGNLDATLASEDGTDQDVLASSLTSMRDQMKQFSKEEKQRNWVTQGLAQFVDILRSKNDNIAELTDNIIRSLIKYMNANQGALYILNDDNAKDVYLEMTACYAYNRKKHLNNRIELGQGITGQVVLEKSTLYMTDVPKDFMRITSGLGEALPRNIVIVPLKINQAVFGVIEIASFDPIPPYQIEFVEKLGESIASTISSVKVSERTKQLLTESQQQAEEMRAQEEEMRQNMEELAATQEDMQRVLKEVQGKEQYMTDLIDASRDSILTVDRDLKVINCNTVFKKSYSGLGMEIDKGFDLTLLFPTEEEKNRYRALYGRVFAGERFEVNDHYKFQNIEAFYLITYSPVTDENGEVIAAAVFVTDITSVTRAKNEAQQQTEEMKAQEEELRQNMEELSATQDEMHRVLKEVQEKEAYINEVLNASKDSIFTVDTDYKLISWNKAFASGLESMGMKVEKGFEILSVFSYDKKKEQEQKSYYTRALAGENFDVTEGINIGGTLAHFASNYSPLRKENGDVFAAAVYGRDVTLLTTALEKANQLATEAQQQAEEVKAQEEELRQNMEELSATQDEMQRILREVQGSEEYLNEVLNASKDSVFTIDEHFKLISWNSAFAVGIEAIGIPIVKGMDILSIYSFDPSKVDSQRESYSRVLKGESFDINETFTINGAVQHYSTSYTPLVRKTGEVFAAAMYARDMTLLTNALNESKRLAAEAQQQAEEVKAQEEELRQNMEELSATQDEMQRVLNEVQAKEQYMVDMINSTKDTIISVDRNYCVVNFNEAMSASYSGMGIKIEKGFDLTKIFSEQEWPKFKSHYDRAFKGESFELTEEYNSNGFNSFFVINYSPLRNEKNEVIAAAVFAKDTTQTVKAQKEAENLQRYYNDVIEGMSDCVVTIDKNYIIVVANTAFKQVFSGYGLSVEPGSSLLAMAKGDKKAEEQFKKPYIKAFAGEHVEEPHRHHFDRDFQVSYNPLKDAKGEVIGVSLIAHDITQRLQLLKESQQQTEEVKAQEEELRQNMEEMQSIQEDVGRKAEEIEKVRSAEKERADSQISAQKKIMETTVEKFRKTEVEYKARIQKLEAELAKNKKGAVA